MVINFIGSDTKVGTTMIASAVAKMLGDRCMLVCKAGAAGSQYEKEKVALFPEDDVHPKEVKEMIKNLSEEYDYVVVDSGSDIYSGLMVGAIESADKNVVITTQQKSSMDKLKLAISDLIKPMNVEAELLINKYIEGAFASVKEIEDIGDFKSTSLVRYSQYGWEAEKEETTLLRYPGFYKDIKKYEKTIRSI